MKARSFKKMCVLLALSLAICLTAATAAFADVVVQLNGTPLETYTSAQLEAFGTTDQDNYSTYKTEGGGSYQYYSVYGPDLVQVLNDALANQGVYDLDDVVNITFTDTGSTPYFSKTLSKSSMLDTTRYYYPSGGGAGVEVDAKIATRSANYVNADLEDLTTTNMPRDFYGQTSSTDYTAPNFVKGVDVINLTT